MSSSEWKSAFTSVTVVNTSAGDSFTLSSPMIYLPEKKWMRM